MFMTRYMKQDAFKGKIKTSLESGLSLLNKTPLSWLGMDDS